MVKRRTKYLISYAVLDADKPGYFQETVFVSATTKKGMAKKIRSLPIDLNINSYLRSTKLIKHNRRVKFAHGRVDLLADIKDIATARRVRSIWHHWNQLIRSIIPDGFRVLTNEYEAIPTALSIRQQLKSLVPTPYNCYLLDRDLRRYLGLELRHD